MDIILSTTISDLASLGKAILLGIPFFVLGVYARGKLHECKEVSE